MLVRLSTKLESFRLGNNFFAREENGDEINWYKEEHNGDYVLLERTNINHIELEKIYEKTYLNYIKLKKINEERFRLKKATYSRKKVRKMELWDKLNENKNVIIAMMNDNCSKKEISTSLQVSIPYITKWMYENVERS